MADITAALTTAFETNYDNESAAAAAIGAAIDSYFVGVTIGTGTGVSGGGLAQSALSGMNDAGAFGEKLGAAVVAAANPSIAAAALALTTGVATGPPTFDFTPSTDPAAQAAYIQAQIDAKVATWTTAPISPNTDPAGTWSP